MLWPVYRLVCEDKITWTEAKTTLSLGEVMDLNEVLDGWNEAAAPPPKDGIF